MPRITSVKQRQLVVTAPDQTKELVVARLGSLSVATYAVLKQPDLLNIETAFNGIIRAVVEQPDGKLIIAGDFTTYQGQAQGRIVRVSRDGTLDPTFVTGTGFNDRVNALALQSDGMIIAGGNFTTYSLAPAVRIVRLTSTGTIDATLNTGTGFGGGEVNAVAVQTDGKILVGGIFGTYNGVERGTIARLLPNGGLDPDFIVDDQVPASDVGFGFNSVVNALALQSDGKILVGGGFTNYRDNDGNTQAGERLTRLNTDSSVDGTWTASSFSGIAEVRAVAIQSDGKIVVGGTFTEAPFGTNALRIVRFNADGTRDSSFDTTTGFNNAVYAISIQSDGKILVGGTFTQYKSVSANGVIRLNADSTRDTTFDIGTGAPPGTIWVVRPISNGDVLIGGDITEYDGVNQAGLCRVSPLGALSLNIESVDEGSSYTFSASTENVGDGTELVWQIIDKPEDFSPTSGSVTLSSGVGTFSVTPLSDLITDGTETFRIRLSKRSGTALAVSGSVTINDTSASSITITPRAASVNEGSSLTIDVEDTSGNIPDGFTLYWTVDSPLDFTEASGSFEINSSLGSFTVTASSDYRTEGSETFTVSVRSQSINGPIINTSDPITINDTSLDPTYEIVLSASDIDEGSALSVTVNTTFVPNGSTLYWTATNSTDFDTASGSFTITDGTGSFSVTPAADFSIDEGSETFQVQIRIDSTSGTIVATSDSITINDTSVGIAPANSVAPVISGTVAVGSTLTCSTGTWSGQPTPTYTYQWQRDSVNIGGATNSTYTLTSDDYETSIRCRVTGTNPSGSVTVNAAATAAVGPQVPSNTSSPTISGDAVVLQTLTVSEGTWAGFPLPTFSYQWLRNGSEISGATNSTYTLTTSDTGSTLLDRYTISCRVTATNVAGSGSATSSSTSTVMPFLGQQVAGGHFVGFVSVSGSGTADHYLITAVKSAEQTLEMRSFAGGETFTGPSDIDGETNTQNFLSLHVPGVREYPAAVYASNYSTGGYTDWYIPSKSELEIAYYNLKPNSGSNNTSTGANSYAVPPRGSNYTTTDPGRTSNTDFREGGAFAFSTFSYWTSTSNSGTTGITAIRFSDGQTTVADGIGQNVVRPFRKVSI